MNGVHFTDREWKFFLLELDAINFGGKNSDVYKAVHNARCLAILEERFESGDWDFSECNSLELDDTARKYFVDEINRQREKSGGVNLATAIKNARYLAKIDGRTKDIGAGKNCITFTDEVWEAFVNAQDLS